MKMDRRAILISALTSFVVTTGLFYADSARQAREGEQWAMRVARQVGEQAQAFLLSSRTEGEDLSIQGVVRNLTQGTDPRVIRVSSIGTQRSPDPRSLEFKKVLRPDGSGVVVSVLLPEVGVLGTHSRLEQDLALGGFWLLLTLSLYSILRRRESQARPAALDPQSIAQTQSTLREIGLRFKSTFDSAREIAVAASRSHHSVKNLRQSMHVRMDRAREAQAIVAEGSLAMTRLEKEWQSLSSEERLVLFRDASLAWDATRKSLRDLEMQLEPWAAEVDLAFTSFEGVQRAAAAMDGQLPQAKSALIEQARLLKKLG